MNWLAEIIKHSPALIVAVPLLGAFLTPLVGMINEKVRNIFALVMISITGFFIALLASDVYANGPRIYVFGAQNLALPVVRILFEVDSLSIFMAIVTFILAFVALVYSWSFMKENDGLDKYYTLVLLLVTSTLGMELTGDIFNFFVFLEISCISSCALIAFWVHKGEALEAAFKYIVISSIGALFVLFAIGIFYAQYNALNIATLANVIQFTFLDKIALVLLVVVLGMKAGLVPMHMWLPDSYGQAPPSVTIVIIGATQASLYGVFRMCFTLYSGAFKNVVISESTIGLIIIMLAILTILIGVLMALIQTDFRRLIGFVAVAEIGYIFLTIGVGLVTLHDPNMITVGKTAMNGGIFHIINDCLDIGLLFLSAGAIYYATKETSLNEMGGLARNMKYTTIFFLIGLLAVSGIPPMNGFASKLLIYQSTYQLNPIISIVAILASIMLLAIFVKVFYSAFLGPKISKFENVKEVPKSMLIGMGVFACIIIFFGLFPNIVIHHLVEPAVNVLMNNAQYISAVLGGV
ncbi:MAG: proton-conducting transporter membrane subunit [Candidatus Thermoplasmatota archaeon]|nr:proton-conducting transporter membrane subunit [Candidatus Thermoplasmatota archaeon]